MRVLTERERDVVAHTEELSEAYEALLRGDSEILHSSPSNHSDVVGSKKCFNGTNSLFNGKADRVGVVRRHHDADLLLAAVAQLLEVSHSAHALRQALVVHVGCRLVVRVDRILVAQQLRPLAFLKKDM